MGPPHSARALIFLLRKMLHSIIQYINYKIVFSCMKIQFLMVVWSFNLVFLWREQYKHPKILDCKEIKTWSTKTSFISCNNNKALQKWQIICQIISRLIYLIYHDRISVKWNNYLLWKFHQIPLHFSQVKLFLSL